MAEVSITIHIETGSPCLYNERQQEVAVKIQDIITATLEAIRFFSIRTKAYPGIFGMVIRRACCAVRIIAHA